MKREKEKQQQQILYLYLKILKYEHTAKYDIRIGMILLAIGM